MSAKRLSVLAGLLCSLIGGWALIDFFTGGTGWDLWAGGVLLVFAAVNFYAAARRWNGV